MTIEQRNSIAEASQKLCTPDVTNRVVVLRDGSFEVAKSRAEMRADRLFVIVLPISAEKVASLAEYYENGGTRPTTIAQADAARANNPGLTKA